MAIDFSAVDWLHTKNIDIARTLHCSDEWIRIKRKQYAPNIKSPLLKDILKNNLKELGIQPHTKTSKELAAILGVSTRTITNTFDDYMAYSRYDWGNIPTKDFYRPDSDSYISKLLGCAKSAVRIYRYRHGILHNPGRPRKGA